MKALDESVAPSDTAPVQNPAAVYLDRLHPSGRLSMRTGTRLCGRNLHGRGRQRCEGVRLVADKRSTGPKSYARSMVDRGVAAGTINHMLSGVRSTVRIAWELGLVDDQTRIAIQDQPNEKPQQRRRGGRYVKRGEVRKLSHCLTQNPLERKLMPHRRIHSNDLAIVGPEVGGDGAHHE